MKLFSRRPLVIVSLLLVAAWAAATWLFPRSSAPTGERIGRIDTALITEASGLACSQQTSDLLWTHNDSGGQPVLYGVDVHAHYRGSVRVIGVRNVDWEDVDSFILDGHPWLLIADVGDNNGNRHDCAIHIIAEPNPAELSLTGELTAAVAWTLPVKYPKGPRDCEAVTIDVKEEKIYLMSKRTRPPELYVLPLRVPADGNVPEAKLIARIPHLPQPSSWDKLFPIPTGRYRGEPTGMSFAANGSQAVVLTYGEVLLFRRLGRESWAAALGRIPQIIASHGLLQAEGVCFSRDGQSIFVTGEEKNPPLVRYSLERRE